MPAGLDRTDRSLLIGAGIVVVVLAIATSLLTPSRRGGRTGFPSSYSTTWDGAKATYLLLGELGYDIHRWDKSPSELANDAHNQVLILAILRSLHRLRKRQLSSVFWTAADGSS